MNREARKPLATWFFILILTLHQLAPAGRAASRGKSKSCPYDKLPKKTKAKRAEPPAPRAKADAPAKKDSAPARQFPVRAAVTAGAGGLVVLAAAQFLSFLFGPESFDGALTAEEEDKLSRLRSGGRVQVPDLYEATRIADYLGIEQSPEFRALPEDQRKQLLEEIFNQMLKMPWKMRAVLAKRKHKFALVLGSVASHPRVRELKTPPHGRKPEQGWDTVTGVTLGDLVIITADRLKDPKAKTRNLVLHEAAHSYDYGAELDTRPIAHVFGRSHGALSSSEAFGEVFRGTDWGLKYYQNHPDEAFAESVARYFDSPESRAELQRDWPLAHEFIRRHFEEPDFPKR